MRFILAGKPDDKTAFAPFLTVIEPGNRPSDGFVGVWSTLEKSCLETYALLPFLECPRCLLLAE
jgi:hypothetical protein